ncbi:MAG: MOSC domain-containing protein, partial [Planctomycetota bacterium]
MATTKGTIKAISISQHRGTKKHNIARARLAVDCGIIGDAHAGNWHRQVSLLAMASIDKMVAIGAMVSPGDFAENITTEGIDLQSLVAGARLRLGAGAEVEVTQFGKECHSRCEIFEEVGDCVMPREGIFAQVTKAGAIEVGDIIEVAQD